MSGKIGIIALKSAEKTGNRIAQILSEWRSGEEKHVIRRSVRDRNLYILVTGL